MDDDEDEPIAEDEGQSLEEIADSEHSVSSGADEPSESNFFVSSGNTTPTLKADNDAVQFTANLEEAAKASSSISGAGESFRQSESSQFHPQEERRRKSEEEAYNMPSYQGSVSEQEAMQIESRNRRVQNIEATRTVQQGPRNLDWREPTQLRDAKVDSAGADVREYINTEVETLDDHPKNPLEFRRSYRIIRR